MKRRLLTKIRKITSNPDYSIKHIKIYIDLILRESFHDEQHLRYLFHA